VNDVWELLALVTMMVATGHVRYDVPTLFTPETLAKTVVAPGTPAVSTPLLSEVATFAVPLQVAVPLVSVAVVGGVVPPDPAFVMVSLVPLAIVFWLVKATVAVAPLTPLKFDRSQVCPVEPVIVPPEE
jgi:Ni,Fe-hydrogenase III small subunit